MKFNNEIPPRTMPKLRIRSFFQITKRGVDDVLNACLKLESVNCLEDARTDHFVLCFIFIFQGPFNDQFGEGCSTSV